MAFCGYPPVTLLNRGVTAEDEAVNLVQSAQNKLMAATEGILECRN
jgi:hypothetical protein